MNKYRGVKMTEEKQNTEQEEPKSDRASKMMGGMMKGLREFGATALEKAEEYGKIATEKAEELTKLGRIKLDIHQMKRSRTKEFAELGEFVFGLSKAKLAKLTEQETYTALSKSIKELDASIKAKEAQAEQAASEEEDK